MLYFYCCEITREGVTMRIDGVAKTNKRLKSLEEVKTLQSEIKEEIENNIGVKGAHIIFLAFNLL